VKNLAIGLFIGFVLGVLSTLVFFYVILPMLFPGPRI
jgi:hypothetical protein